ncbi:MAG: 50S ribosomal protein L18 [Cumulibacter sp.]
MASSAIARTGGHGVAQQRRNSKARRHFRLRKKIAGTAARPRLVVTRSARHVVAQIVDDSVGRTLVSATSMEADVRAAGGDKTAVSKKVGELVAARAKDAGISAVVFDRAGNQYHGRIAALADAARSGGLDF